MEFFNRSSNGVNQSSEEKFDLIGLISVFGTAAATESLSYSALNDDWFYVTGHIGPGSLSVAAALFKASGFRLGHLLALGGRRDAYHLLQLDCPHGLHYIGLKSNTECPVLNAVGSSIVREHRSLWKIKQSPGLGQSTLKHRGGDDDGEVRKLGRNAQREVKVIILEIEGRTKEEMRVLLKAGKGGALLLGWLPLFLTVAVMASCCNCNEWFVAELIGLGTLGMMVAAMGLRLCVFKYPKPQVARAAPAGDCLVVDETDADTLHIILGEEDSIQALFQRQIGYQASHGKYALFLAASILYVYVVTSVLSMPKVSARGQILFAIANLIGLVADMVKASNNGKLGLAKKACEQFEIVPRSLVVFRNRTAAVAHVAKYAKDRTILKAKKLLPSDGPVWQKWWEELAKHDGKIGDTSTISYDALAGREDKELLKVLLEDMMDGLKA